MFILTPEQKNMKQLDFRASGDQGVIQERLFQEAKKAKTIQQALELAPPFYKPFILKKWWPKLNLEEKKSFFVSHMEIL